MNPSFGLPGGYVPLGDRSVLVQQFGHSHAGFGTPAVAGLLEELAELDPRLGFGPGRGSEADRAPGERVGSGVHGNPV